MESKTYLNGGDNLENKICLKDLDEEIHSVYFTESDNVIEKLYSPLLGKSVRYVRGAGYFRSSVFRLMTEELLDFAIRGGKMTLLTSIHIDEKDYKTVMSNLNEDIFIKELKEMREDTELIDATDMLAALICHGSLRIKIGIRKSGIYHKKIGFFEDSCGCIVSFQGSGNETLSALNPNIDEGNSDSFAVYKSWNNNNWKSHGEEYYKRL